MASAPAGVPPIEPGHDIFSVHLGPKDFGTIGMVVKDLNDHFALRFLTCDHVVPKPGQIVKSASLPGIPDVGKVLPKNQRQRSTLVDCALILPKAGLVFSKEIPGFPGPYTVGRISKEDSVNKSPVIKVGAKTGVTHGRVHQHDGTIDAGGFLMINQIAVLGNDGPGSFSQGGDSGAILIRDRPGPVELVGLVFAENPKTGMSMACHLLDVLDVLEVTV